MLFTLQGVPRIHVRHYGLGNTMQASNLLHVQLSIILGCASRFDSEIIIRATRFNSYRRTRLNSYKVHNGVSNEVYKVHNGVPNEANQDGANG